MIVLGKDKEDYRYNISDDGIITDLNGNVQKTYLNQGHQKFKRTAVHRILMYTKFGYQNLDIHHKDENKLNNSLNNLEFKSRSEHIKLHMKGKKLSEEHKKKLSEAKKKYWIEYHNSHK